MMRKPKFGSIYLITNTANGKVYVGLTRSYVSDRWYGHKLAAKNGASSALYRAMRKYGVDKFEIEHIASAVSLDVLGELETQLIAQYGSYGKAGYNCSYGGEAHLERRLTEEGLESVRAARRSPEARQRNSARQRDRMKTDAGRSHQARMVEAARAAKDILAESRRRYAATEAGANQIREASRKGARRAAELRSKAVSVGGVLYASVRHAAESFGIERAAVRWRLKSPHFTEWSWG